MDHIHNSTMIYTLIWQPNKQLYLLGTLHHPCIRYKRVRLLFLRRLHLYFASITGMLFSTGAASNKTECVPWLFRQKTTSLKEANKEVIIAETVITIDYLVSILKHRSLWICEINFVTEIQPNINMMLAVALVKINKSFVSVIKHWNKASSWSLFLLSMQLISLSVTSLI